MASTINRVKVKVKRPSPTKLAQLRRQLHGRYAEVAAASGCSWFMVWAVLNGKKTSAPVLAKAEQIAGAA